jgi:hypothetical protein
MRFQWWDLLRTKLPIVGVIILAVIVGTRSGVAVRAEDGASRPRPASTHFCLSTGTYCFDFETVDATGTGHCNAVTGINDAEQIVGTYYPVSNGSCSSTGSKGSATYQSYAAAPSQETTMYTSPAPYPSPFTSESDNGASTVLQGLATGQAGQNFKNVYMVGYGFPSGCSQSCGVQNVNGNGQQWTTISDPGAASCGVTQVMAVNDSHIGVGFYLKSTLSGCTKQAFEYYPSTVAANGVNYVDLNPGPGASIATGISPLGAVVGYSIGKGGAATGWLYADRKYYTINGPTSSASIYPEGVNFSDGVVGYYVENSSTNGFLMLDGRKGGSGNLLTVNYLNDTVIRSLNTHWYFSGWANGSGGTSHGFVGKCIGCPGNNTTSGADRLRSIPRMHRP